jgi:hypothetical protein
MSVGEDRVASIRSSSRMLTRMGVLSVTRCGVPQPQRLGFQHQRAIANSPAKYLATGWRYGSGRARCGPCSIPRAISMSLSSWTTAGDPRSRSRVPGVSLKPSEQLAASSTGPVKSSGCTRRPRGTWRGGRRCRRRWRACWPPRWGSPPRSPARACWRRRAAGPRCRRPAPRARR